MSCDIPMIINDGSFAADVLRAKEKAKEAAHNRSRDERYVVQIVSPKGAKPFRYVGRTVKGKAKTVGFVFAHRFKTPADAEEVAASVRVSLVSNCNVTVNVLTETGAREFERSRSL